MRGRCLCACCVQAAIRHGCTIIPCTSVGTEDMTEVVYDLPLGWVPIPFLWGSDRTVSRAAV